MVFVNPSSEWYRSHAHILLTSTWPSGCHLSVKGSGAESMTFPGYDGELFSLNKHRMPWNRILAAGEANKCQVWPKSLKKVKGIACDGGSCMVQPSNSF